MLAVEDEFRPHHSEKLTIHKALGEIGEYFDFDFRNLDWTANTELRENRDF